ncbi:hypothetical protein DXH95_03270 [Sphingorhabdus pulchriflava]|uniref:DUF4136 domain-containing protein n=2 Tax=Sphingorhabdus pulchriflava TaxID=2292257 RepID=A0A371BGH7_9SPHN|nr:hypothetical protein DXH95_03270 [Sphingorhabdus pulchriflava]
MGLRWVVPLAAIMLISACTGPIETRVSSSGVALSSDRTILNEQHGNHSDILVQARSLTLQQLDSRGFSLAPNGAHKLDVTVSERPANLLVTTGTEQGKAVLTSPKPKKPLQSCVDSEFNLVVRLTRVADGTELYRGRASEYHCKASLADVLPFLVNAALADLSSPKGEHIIKRRGFD